MSRVARCLRCLILLAALPGLAWAGSHARDRDSQPAPAPTQAPAPRSAQNVPSALPDSVRRVERRTGGEVLRAEPMQRDGRQVYRIKVLTADGRVRVVQDDPDRRGADPRRRKDKDSSSSDRHDADQEPPQY